MDYDQFKKAYKAAFKSMMSYKPNQIGSAVYAEEMAKLADDYPEFAERVEAEID